MNQMSPIHSAAKQAPAVELRAHHLLCALTFRSKGYGPDFVQTFDEIVQQLIAGRTIKLIRHADSLCLSGQNCGHCNQQQSAERDDLAIAAIKQALDIDEQLPFSLDVEKLDTLRRAFAEKTLRQACCGCAWFKFCSSIAASNFTRAHLQLPA